MMTNLKHALMLGSLFAMSALSSCEKRETGPDKNGTNEPKDKIEWYDNVYIDGQSPNDGTIASIGFGVTQTTPDVRHVYIPRTGEKNTVEFIGEKPLIETSDMPERKGEVIFYLADENDIFKAIKDDGSVITYKPVSGATIEIGQIYTNDISKSMQYSNEKAANLKGLTYKFRM